MNQPPVHECDYALVGGGLQSALIALALRARRPDASIALIEREPRLGGNHTWCFHEHDIAAGSIGWIEPLISHRWPSHEVRFPGTTRTLPSAYAAIRSETLHEILTDLLSSGNDLLLLDASADLIHPRSVELQDGREIRAKIVIDARGPSAEATPNSGYQKFVGHEIELGRPHGVTQPVLMDATVDQSDGFRFFYLLPFTGTRLLVEDTRFTSGPELPVAEYRSAIAEYCDDNGWGEPALIREETGVVPMPWQGSIDQVGAGPITAGYRGGWFHPGTGYSLPVAARLAEAIATLEPDNLRSGGLDSLRAEIQVQREYCHFLNRLLFQWYPPATRWHVFARFYRLPASVIQRFYGLRLKPADRMRILVGRPPRGLSLKHRIAGGRPS